jgi:phospho-2-dehydro-3-deoxyheptonate aldolase
VITGPCSVHDPRAAAYAERLAAPVIEVENEVLVNIRVNLGLLPRSDGGHREFGPPIGFAFLDPFALSY